MTNAKIVASLPSYGWRATTKMTVIGLPQICNAAEFLPMYVGQWQVMLLGKRGSYSILKKLNTAVNRALRDKAAQRRLP